MSGGAYYGVGALFMGDVIANVVGVFNDGGERAARSPSRIIPWTRTGSRRLQLRCYWEGTWESVIANAILTFVDADEVQPWEPADGNGTQVSARHPLILFDLTSPLLSSTHGQPEPHQGESSDMHALPSPRCNHYSCNRKGRKESI